MAELVVDVRGALDGAGDLVAQEVAVAAAEPVDGDAQRAGGLAEPGGELVAGGLVADEEALELLEPLALALLGVLALGSA